MRAAALPLVLIAILAGCSCPEVKDFLRYAEADLSTPDEALEYFRLALERDDARHQFLLFSQELKRYWKEEEGADVTLANYTFIRDDLMEWFRTEIGSPKNIEIGSVTYDRDKAWLADVTLHSRTRREVVRMIQEVEYAVHFTDGETVSGFLDPGTDPVALGDGKLVLSLALDKPQAPGADAPTVYRIDYYREWKILELKNSPFSSKMGEWWRKRQAEREKKEAAGRDPGSP